MRGLGLGYHKAGKSQAEWVRGKISYLDQFTSYRMYLGLLESFGRVTPTLEDHESDYIAFRLRRKGLNWAEGLVRYPLGKLAARFVCRKLVGLVLIARKPRIS